MSEAIPEKQDLVLRPYSPPPETRDRARRRIVVAAAVFCFFYGAFFALTAPYLIIPMLAPLVVMGAFIIWALPQSLNPPLKLLEGLFFAFLIGLVMWPNYLAIALPGLPWVTVVRLTSAPMALILLICWSTSLEFRNEITKIIAVHRYIFLSIFSFIAYQAISIIFSENKGSSTDIFINAQTSCAAGLFVGCYLFSKPGRARQFSVILCVTAAILSGIGLLEYKMDRILWAGHIPSFLKVQSETVQKILAGTSRGIGPHRVQVTFSTALGLSEFLGGIAFPFFGFIILTSKANWVRILAVMGVPVVVLAIVLTQARVGLIGVVGTLLLYPAILVARQWRLNPNNLSAASGLFLSPLFVLAAGSAGLAIPGIRIRLLGGGQAQLSNLARQVQWHMGVPKILKSPWGHGIGQGATALGYYTPGGFLTIDSYTLRLGMEYGVVGLILFYFIFCSAIYFGALTAIDVKVNKHTDPIAIPLTISIVNYLVIATVFAQEENLAMIYAILGCLFAQASMPRETPIESNKPASPINLETGPS